MRIALLRGVNPRTSWKYNGIKYCVACQAQSCSAPDINIIVRDRFLKRCKGMIGILAKNPSVRTKPTSDALPIDSRAIMRELCHGQMLPPELIGICVIAKSVWAGKLDVQDVFTIPIGEQLQLPMQLLRTSQSFEVFLSSSL